MRECIRLAQTLNFTQTARDFYITQPVLSKHISNLERDLGGKLFVRDQHGVSLTKAGEIFVRDAASVVAEYDLAVENVRLISSGKRQVLTIGYLFGAARKILPPTIDWFSKFRPDVELQFVALEVDGVLDAIDLKKIDIGITTSFNAAPLSSSRYGWLPLYPDRLAVVVPKSHRLASKQSVHASELIGERILQPAPPFMANDSEKIMRVFSPIKEDIIIRKKIHDVLSMQILMETGNYITVTFDHVRNLLGDDYVYLPIEEANAQFDVGVLWMKANETRTHLLFAQALKKQVDDQR